jgi:glycosyltransferase involved in cell wall biosynthesis
LRESTLKSARAFFGRCYWWATRSRLTPMIKVAHLLKRHLANILTYLIHRVTNAVTKGLNAKIQYLAIWTVLGSASLGSLITINRQLKEKNPENIIRAIRDIDCRYLIVGDGAYHDYLKTVAEEAGCADKVEFVKAIPNAKLCKMLKDFDLMVSHCDYWGISKTVIEAALCGLPVIINHHSIEPIPDYEGDWVRLCDNSPCQQA